MSRVCTVEVTSFILLAYFLDLFYSNSRRGRGSGPLQLDTKNFKSRILLIPSFSRFYLGFTERGCILGNFEENDRIFAFPQQCSLLRAGDCKTNAEMDY